MALIDREVGLAVAATTALLSPRAREVARKGAVYGLAGVLKVGDVVVGTARGAVRGASEGVSGSNGASKSEASPAEPAGTTDPPLTSDPAITTEPPLNAEPVGTTDPGFTSEEPPASEPVVTPETETATPKGLSRRKGSSPGSPTSGGGTTEP